MPDADNGKPPDAPESPADRAARRTATATWWIAVFTIVLAFVSIITLREVHEGGADTHALAIAAGKQADAAKALAEQAKAQTDKMTESLAKTDALIENATAQAKATAVVASASQKFFTLQSELFAIEQRPYVWVKEFLIVGDAKAVKSNVPMFVNVIFVNGGKGIGRNIDITSKNFLIATSEKAALSSGILRPSSDPNHGGVIPPGEQFKTTVSGGPFSVQDVTDITNRATKQLYVFGTILYSDTGNIHHYRTDWCTIIMPQTNGTSYGVCEYGTDMN